MMPRPPPDDLSLKETKITGDKLITTYDLVEQMQYLYVRVVKARFLPAKDVTGSCDPCAEVQLGNYKGRTRRFEKKSNPEWNQVFAFSRERTQSNLLEVTVTDKGLIKDDFMGRVVFDLAEVPVRVPPDSPLAPEWYRLEDWKGMKLKGEVMLAVWWGTQADEAFPQICYSNESAELTFYDDFSLKEGQFHPHEHAQQKQYLYVRLVKARDLLVEGATAGCDCYIEVRLGNYKETTRHLTLSKKNQNPEWNQVFAFLRDKIEATMLEITVKDKNVKKDDFVGWVLYDLSEIPKRVQPDCPLAPQWYRLEDRKGDKVKGELMCALWWGTQADEAFPKANSGGVVDPLARVRSKVYYSPRLWYLRVNVIEGQDLIPSDRTRSPESFVNVTLGKQSMKTQTSMAKSKNPSWNEELMFVAAEPFEEHLILSVEDRVAPNMDEVLGSCVIPLQYVERRLDQTTIRSRWFNLQRDVIVDGQRTKQARFASRIHVRICFEGGYHVLDEPAHYCSDLRPAAKQLWKKSIGILELGILGAHGLPLMKIKDGLTTTDAYCVAKFGTKWVRTRTITNNFNPKWNEQYTWEVFDPCSIITIGVFDNNFHLQGGDKRIGKVRIRLSTLETDRVYTHSYPLLVLHPSGVKNMGEIRLAVRFSCSSLLNMMHMYSQPLLPKMHYIHPLTITQLDNLRYHAAQIVSMKLSQAEPPLKKEVVQYMLDVGCDMWSMRRSKANFLRIKQVFGGLIAVGKWFGEMYSWKNPISTVAIHIIFFILAMDPKLILSSIFLTLFSIGVWNYRYRPKFSWKNPISTVAIHIIFFILAMYPKLILSSIFLTLFSIGVWNYRYRPKFPPYMDTHLSCADNALPDELDEEFDTIPTSHPPDIISMRYDRLRRESGRIQRVVGDIATVGERLQSLLCWRDPIGTSMFVLFCLIAAVVLYAAPFYVVVIQTVIFVLTHRNKRLPSVPINFFSRLPAKTDSML